MLHLIGQADSRITSYIAMVFPHNIVFDYLFSFLSLKGDSIIIWAIVLLLLFLFEEKRNHKFLIYFLTSFAVTSVINNNLLKNLFHKPRPVFHLAVPYHCPTDFGLPSGHAAGAFSAAFIFASFDRKRAWLYYLLASMVGFSRIYLGCHYFSDVIVGAVVGTILSFIILQLDRFFFKRIKNAKK